MTRKVSLLMKEKVTMKSNKIIVKIESYVAYKCTFCGLTFVGRQTIKKHLKDVHPCVLKGISRKYVFLKPKV